MPFATQYPTGILLLPEDIAAEVPVMIDETPSFPESGWDSLRRRYFLHDTTRADAREAAAYHFARGDQLTDLAGALINAWIVDFGVKTLGPAFYEIDVLAKGILDARGYKVSGSAAAGMQSGQNITGPDSTVHPKAQTMESEPTLVIEYLLLGEISGITFPTAVVGTAQTPPFGWAPPVAPSPWSWIADPTWHYPSGWTVVGSDFDLLPGVTGAALIKDRWQYIREYTP